VLLPRVGKTPRTAFQALRQSLSLVSEAWAPVIADLMDSCLRIQAYAATRNGFRTMRAVEFFITVSSDGFQVISSRKQ